MTLQAILAALLSLLAWFNVNAHQPAPVRRPAPQRASRGVERIHAATAPTGPCGGWRALVARYDWPVEKACSVLWCESKGDPNARNRHSTASGLFQILGGPIDPERNVAQAYAMWRARGWQPWVCQ